MSLNPDSSYARWSYERLRYLQPHIVVGRLWTNDGRYYVECPGLEGGLETSDGRDLVEWFRYSCRAATCPIELTGEPPPDGAEVRERTREEIAGLRGEPLTVRDVLIYLNVNLPKEIPRFRFSTKPPMAYIRFEGSLDDEMRSEVARVFGALATGLELKVEENCERAKSVFRSRKRQGDIDLLPSRLLPEAFSPAFKRLYEEDEDYWASTRTSILAPEPSQIPLPTGDLNDGATSCIVDCSVFPPMNIRVYLSLYQRCTIVMPLAEKSTRILENLGVTEEELAILAAEGRVRILMPQSPDRYHPRIVNRLAEQCPGSIVLSRRLAAETIIDARNRIPILYPPLDARERYQLLHLLTRIPPDAGIKDISVELTRELGRIWSTADYMLNNRGAMSTQVLGIGSIAAVLIQRMTRRDLTLEAWNSASTVEWAAITGSTVFPVNTTGYSEQAITEFIASLYSGVNKEVVPTHFGDVDIVADELFGVDNDTDVLEFSQIFTGDELLRVHSLVKDLVEKNPDPDFLREEIRKFNLKVEKFEKRIDRQKRIQLLTGGAALLPLLLKEAPYVDVVPIGSWLLYLALEGIEPKGSIPTRLVDFMRGTNAWVSPDVVLVSRVKQRVRSARK